MVIQVHVGLVHCEQQLFQRVAVVIGQTKKSNGTPVGNKRELMICFVVKERAKESARTKTVNEEHESRINDPSSANRGTIAGESKLDPQVELFSIEFVTRECFKYRR